MAVIEAGCYNPALPASVFASILRVPPSTVRQWTARGALRPVDRARYRAADLAVGAALLELQYLLGEQSPLPFRIVRELRDAILASFADAKRTGRGVPVAAMLRDTTLGTEFSVSLAPETFEAVVQRLEQFGQ